ncbi:hypothetical protein AVT69_gp296 [Pseudomonas phage PhiPA3]|uniref:Uncharacterized protein 298 n=1 Tax=Pseudomonas phage PhiPA3 TaxID=998086 RepID=F8SJD4_BPPA3|nr:hypothetical protein AVT69_gp296 [Pseudomonas phage PhiPA3]AEH03721.1 hypothetical protein [Pseudomonas phage PhiPA3]
MFCVQQPNSTPQVMLQGPGPTMNKLDALYLIQKAQLEAILGVYTSHYRKDACNDFQSLTFGMDGKDATVYAGWMSEGGSRSVAHFKVVNLRTNQSWLFCQNYNFNVAMNVEIWKGDVDNNEKLKDGNEGFTLDESNEFEWALGYLTESLAEWMEYHPTNKDTIN